MLSIIIVLIEKRFQYKIFFVSQFTAQTKSCWARTMANVRKKGKIMRKWRILEAFRSNYPADHIFLYCGPLSIETLPRYDHIWFQESIHPILFIIVPKFSTAWLLTRNKRNRDGKKTTTYWTYTIGFLALLRSLYNRKISSIIFNLQTVHGFWFLIKVKSVNFFLFSGKTKWKDE